MRIVPGTSLLRSTIVLFTLGICLGAFAGIGPITPKFPFPAGADRSFWKASDGSGSEIWLIARADGLMELKGKDLASTFEGLLLAGEEPGTYHCHGTGFRFEGGIGFTYRSSFVIREGAPSILIEDWTATLANGETIKGRTELHLAFPVR